jgi:hypothetical protein
MGYDSISHVGRHPQLASMPGGELVIVWDETVQHMKQSNKRIGLQVRAADGINLGTYFITPDDFFSSYPVVASLNNRSSLVAYCSKKGEKSYIVYQSVKLEI